MYQPTGIAKSLTATIAEGDDNSARNSSPVKPTETCSHMGETPRDNPLLLGVLQGGRQPLMDIGNTTGTVQPSDGLWNRNHAYGNGRAVVFGDMSEGRTPPTEHKDMLGVGSLTHSGDVNDGRGAHTACGGVLKSVNTMGGGKNDSGGVCADARGPFSQHGVETAPQMVKIPGINRRIVLDSDRAGSDVKENDSTNISRRVSEKSSDATRSKCNRLSLKSRIRRDGSTYSASASRRVSLEIPVSVSSSTEGEVSKPLVKTPANTDHPPRDTTPTVVLAPEPPSPIQTSYVYEDISDADEGGQGISHNAQHTPNNQNIDLFEPLNNALNALAAVGDGAGGEMPGSQSLTPEQLRGEFHELVRITCGVPSVSDDACALNSLTLAADELMLDISTQSAFSTAQELIQLCSSSDIEQCVNTYVETDSTLFGVCVAEEGVCEDAQGTSTQDLLRDTIHWQTPTSEPPNTQPPAILESQNTNHPDIIVIHSDDESEGSASQPLIKGGGRPSVIKLNPRNAQLDIAEITTPTMCGSTGRTDNTVGVTVTEQSVNTVIVVGETTATPAVGVVPRVTNNKPLAAGITDRQGLRHPQGASTNPSKKRKNRSCGDTGVETIPQHPPSTLGLALPSAKKCCKADSKNNTLKTRPPPGVAPPHPAEGVLTQPKNHKNKSSGPGGAAWGYTPVPSVGTAVPGYAPSGHGPHAHPCAKRKSPSCDNSAPGAKYRRMMAAGKRVLQRCAALAKTPENAGIFEHYEAYFDYTLEKEGEFTKALETARDQSRRPVQPGVQWYQTPLNPQSSGRLTHFVQIGGPAGRMVRVVEDGEQPSTSADAGTSGTGQTKQRGSQHPA